MFHEPWRHFLGGIDLDSHVPADHSGSFCDPDYLSAIADWQGCRPVCAAEMLENIAQIMYGDFRGQLNGLSDAIERLAGIHGWGTWESGGMVIDPQHYGQVLEQLGLASHWQPFDVDQVHAALASGRPIGAFVDMGSLGYPISGPHAITLTGSVTGEGGLLTGFQGIDSNLPGQVQTWSVEQIATGVQALLDSEGAWWAGKVLVPAAL
jgi:hypothetical protein